VHGTVTDRNTGRPVPGAYLAVVPGGPARWTRSDSLGRFWIMPVAPGNRQLVVQCPRQTGLWADTIRIAVQSGPDTSVSATVPAPSCSKPPRTIRTGVFTGLYETGFEAFGFLPDPDDTGLPLLWDVWRSARATFLPSAHASEYPWPNARTPQGYSCYAVRLHGTLDGPRTGDGVNVIGGDYELRVDSIVSIVAAAPRRCPSG